MANSHNPLIHDPNENMAEIIHFFLLIVCFQITTEIPIKAVTFCYKADGSTALTWKDLPCFLKSCLLSQICVTNQCSVSPDKPDFQHRRHTFTASVLIFWGPVKSHFLIFFKRLYLLRWIRLD